MRLQFALLALLLVSAAPLAAHADTTQDYNLSATLPNGSASGIISIDITSGVITGGDFTFNDGSGPVTIDEAANGSGSFDTVSYGIFDYAGGDFQLAVAGTSSLINYAGGSTCSMSAQNGCQVTGQAGNFYPTAIFFNGGAQDDASIGSLTPAPEPSSLALLGTGLLGVAGVVKRKFIA